MGLFSKGNGVQLTGALFLEWQVSLSWQAEGRETPAELVESCEERGLSVCACVPGGASPTSWGSWARRGPCLPGEDGAPCRGRGSNHKDMAGNVDEMGGRFGGQRPEERSKVGGECCCVRARGDLARIGAVSGVARGAGAGCRAQAAGAANGRTGRRARGVQGGGGKGGTPRARARALTAPEGSDAAPENNQPAAGPALGPPPSSPFRLSSHLFAFNLLAQPLPPRDLASPSPRNQADCPAPPPPLPLDHRRSLPCSAGPVSAISPLAASKSPAAHPPLSATATTSTSTTLHAAGYGVRTELGWVPGFGGGQAGEPTYRGGAQASQE